MAIARAHMPMLTASCGRTRITAGPPASEGFVLSVPAPTMGRPTCGRDERNLANAPEHLLRLETQQRQPARYSPIWLGAQPAKILRQPHDPIMVGLDTQRLIDAARKKVADRPQRRLRGDGAPGAMNEEHALDRVLR